MTGMVFQYFWGPMDWKAPRIAIGLGSPLSWRKVHLANLWVYGGHHELIFMGFIYHLTSQGWGATLWWVHCWSGEPHLPTLIWLVLVLAATGLVFEASTTRCDGVQWRATASWSDFPALDWSPRGEHQRRQARRGVPTRKRGPGPLKDEFTIQISTWRICVLKPFKDLALIWVVLHV